MATNSEMTLSEAAGRFLAMLKEDERAQAQAELNRFVRHFGSDLRTSSLRPIDVEDYQERVERTGVDAASKLGPIKNFLTFVYKQNGTETNLGRLIKARRSMGARVAVRKSVRSAAPAEDGIIQVTSEGYQNLKQELEYLTTVKRAEIARDLYEARIDKDFRENAPYDAAKQHQAEVEARIRQLEHTLAVAQIVDQSIGERHQVGIGSTVRLKDLTHDEELTYTLVGTSEANPKAGRISTASPVGRALLDRQVGDEVEVAAPIGIVRYRIEEIIS
ncbi:MAG TPA: transcription elongation factor GreA [Chloroflexota bacterium]|jgi:transcription elongation factor GreA|nr:transcription elongation factor GreA [Chloroflexota bacterium]